MGAQEILNAINSEVYGVWFLIGAALVFWMRAGFAMVETGFVHSKNASKESRGERFTRRSPFISAATVG